MDLGLAPEGGGPRSSKVLECQGTAAAVSSSWSFVVFQYISGGIEGSQTLTGTTQWKLASRCLLGNQILLGVTYAAGKASPGRPVHSHYTSACYLLYLS